MLKYEVMTFKSLGKEKNKMEKRLIFRCPDQMLKQIEARMKSEYPKYKNVSQLIRASLEQFLETS